jgi:toxin CptA
MHSAPSVSYPVGRSRFAGALLLGVWLLGAGACAAWRVAAPVSSGRSGVAVVVVVCAGLFAAWRWWHMPMGTLIWDQEQWGWSGGSAGLPAVPQVSLDLQDWLLLRWRPHSGSRWLWLERASRPEQWADLRRAVYSRARADASSKAGPSAAKS